MNGLRLKKSSDTIKYAAGSDVTLAEGAAGVGKVAGWASTPALDSYREIIAQGAFQDSITAAGVSGPGGIQLLVGHDWDKPAGVITVLEYRAKGLWIEAELDLNISWARDFYYASKAKGGLSFSVGFRPPNIDDIDWFEDAEGNTIIVIKKAELTEVSVVARPANQEAIMAWVKSADDKPALPKMTPISRPAEWSVMAARNLASSASLKWDAAAAADVLLADIGKDGFNAEFARRAFLVSDASAPNSKSAYRHPIASVVNGRLCVNSASLADARKSVMADAEMSDLIKAQAIDVLDQYAERFEKAAKELTLPVLKSLLVSEGWVKNEEAADGLVEIVRAHVDLFRSPSVKDDMAKSVAKVSEAMNRLKTLLNKKEG